MKFAIDLHIHTALSPCGDRDMTPGNIINMAILKGLDIISITDHNSCKNVEVAMDVAKELGILLIPGMELQTKEEIHLLCYFKKLEDALTFDKKIAASLPDRKNNASIFGEQILFDKESNPIGIEEKLLLSSANLTIEEAFDLIKQHHGIGIPAHVDRSSYSMISSLGFIPPNLPIQTVEISKKAKGPIPRYQNIVSSDAHYLWDINEREHFIEMEILSMTNLFHCLSKD